jgi:Tol biopolymer transport system component
MKFQPDWSVQSAKFLGWGAVVGALSCAVVAYAAITLRSVQQVSIGTNGTAPQGTSGTPVFSSNGRYLAFRSDAPNIVEDDTNSANDVFLLDQTTSTVSRVSVSSSGVEGDAGSQGPALSSVAPDGFFAAAFQSTASNLGSTVNTGGNFQIHIRFPTLGITELITPSFLSPSVPGDAPSFNPSVAVLPGPNRALVAYSSDASDLVSIDQNGEEDVFLSEVTPTSATEVTISTTLISKNSSSGLEADGNSSTPVLSGDGRYVAFATLATNIVSGFTTSGSQIVLYDRQTATHSLISQSADGIAGNGDSFQPTISFSGRFIAYVTSATNIIGDVTQDQAAIVLFDRQTNRSVRINRNTDGVAGNGSGSRPSISANGRFVAFTDDSTNLVPDDTNNRGDVFIKDTESGDLIRVSVAADGTEGNSDSDFGSASLQSFNSLVSRIGYRSFATNLTDSPTLGGGEIVVSEAQLPRPAFNRKEKLEAPPDVTVRSRRTKVVMQQFGAIVLSSTSGLPPGIAAATRQSLRFDVRVENTRRRGSRVKLVSKRNTVTSKRLKPGTYTVRYRVEVRKGDKTVATSAFSPRQMVTIS